MKSKIILYLIFCLTCACFAGVNMGGFIIDIQTQLPVSDATVSIVGTNLSATTSDTGFFLISNIPVQSTGFQFKASKAGYVDTYTMLGNAGTTNVSEVSFPVFSNTMYSNMHSVAFGGIAHTSGKADIVGTVDSSNKAGVSEVVISAKYMDTNANAGTIRYVNTNSMPDSSLTSTSSNGAFIIYNVDPYRPIKIIGTKAGSVFSSSIVIGYPDKITVGGIEQVSNLLQLSAKVLWDENPVSGATVSIPGTTTTTTSAADGSFTLDVNPTSYGVLKISKTNYIDSYFTGRADEEGRKQNGDDEEEFFAIPVSDYNSILGSLGKSHVSGKGDIIGEVLTINYFSVAGATISVYDRNGTKLNPDIIYFNEEGEPDISLTSTTSDSNFLVLNLDPGYYFITAEKSGFEFSRNMAVVFANGITSPPEIISYPPLPGIAKAKAEDIPSANVSKSAENVKMLAFMLNLMKWNTDESVIFDSVIVTAKGTGNISTSLSSAKLYLDSNNDGSYETLVSTGIISGTKITFNNINKEVDMGLNQRYLVVFNFNGSASIGQTFGVDILKNSDVSAHAKDSGLHVTCEGDEPVVGNLMTIANVYPPVQPVNISPENGATGIMPFNYVLQSSAFNAGQGSNTHKASQWRIWKDGETQELFTWYGFEDQINLTTIHTPVPLEGLTKYWWQVRHENGDNAWSDWSNPTNFTTDQGGITRPTKPSNQSPSDGEEDVSQPVTLTASAFVSGTHPQHVASQWQVFLATKNGGPVIDFDTGRDTNNLTSITLPLLLGNSPYMWRVRYQDGYGAWSQWSDYTLFTTRQGMKGDLNNDNNVDISDVILCLRMAIGLDPINLYPADMNNDQQVDIADVILILRKAIGLD